MAMTLNEAKKLIQTSSHVIAELVVGNKKTLLLRNAAHIRHRRRLAAFVRYSGHISSRLSVGALIE
jgi:hypothetical protein